VQARERLAGRLHPGVLPAGACGVVKEAGEQVERYVLVPRRMKFRESTMSKFSE
jgi:hypothetical protein